MIEIFSLLVTYNQSADKSIIKGICVQGGQSPTCLDLQNHTVEGTKCLDGRKAHRDTLIQTISRSM